MKTHSSHKPNGKSLTVRIKNLDPSMIINLPKRRLVLGKSGKNMTEKKSILNSLFGILVFFALVFSIWGCGDSDSDNQPEPSASYVGIFGHSQDPDQGWYATTTLDDSGKKMGQVLVPYFLKPCNKKQDNYAAILISCSVEAAKKAFRMFVNFTPLSVN